MVTSRTSPLAIAWSGGTAAPNQLRATEEPVELLVELFNLLALELVLERSTRQQSLIPVDHSARFLTTQPKATPLLPSVTKLNMRHNVRVSLDRPAD
jgi:hypothetical protein